MCNGIEACICLSFNSFHSGYWNTGTSANIEDQDEMPYKPFAVIKQSLET